MKNILITGANFGNKGAQSMLFITVDELRKKYGDCKIWFSSYEIADVENYKFEQIVLPVEVEKILLDDKKKNFYIIKYAIESFINKLLHRRTIFHFSDIKKCKEAVEKCDLIVDVSGFRLGDKWSYNANLKYLNYLAIAKKYNKPIYLMPQSYGPFEYKDGSDELLKMISEYLPYAKMIFAREQEGYDLLTCKFNLTNVVKSTDLVLQNKGIDLNNIFYNIPEIDVPVFQDGKIVGIVPNIQCFNRIDRDEFKNLYKKIIDELLSSGFRVVIFRHSNEDLKPCEFIYSGYSENEKVILLKNDFSCIEYEQFIRQFTFIVCSRYHGVVHAYRNKIPCIILSWAIKYKELAQNVNQEQFVYDITKCKEGLDNIIAGINWMKEHYIEESETIEECVKKIQEDNCFTAIA